MRETILVNPKWLNNLFKSIIDLGRKKIENIFQNLYKEIELKKNYCKKSNCYKFLKKTLTELKGKTLSHMEMEEIWKNKLYKEQSIVDKVSYHSLLEKLEKLQNLAEEENIVDLLKDLKQTDEETYDIAQCIYTIDETDLFNEIISLSFDSHENLKERKNFILAFLTRFDLILPKDRVKYQGGVYLSSSQTFLVPFLFPQKKPKSFVLKNNYNVSNIKRNHHWIIEYDLPYKPSSMFKTLFLRIRKICIKSEEKQKMLGKKKIIIFFYFYFYFIIFFYFIFFIFYFYF